MPEAAPSQAAQGYGVRYDDLVEGLRESIRMGEDRMAARFAAAIENKEYDEESSMAASALQGIGQGATFGFADEAAAAVRAGTGEFFDKWLGSTLYGLGVGIDTEGDERGFLDRFRDYKAMAEDERTLGERYQTALESQRRAVETARREDPWTTGVAEVVGGLGSGGVGVARSVGGLGARQAAQATGRELGEQVAQRTLGEGVRAGLRSGVGYGALAGYGYSEGDPIATAVFEVMNPTGPGGTRDFQLAMRELTEAGVGAGVGGLMGAGFGAIMPVIGAGIRGAGRWLLNPFTREARLNEVGRRQIADLIEQDLRSGEWADEAERLGISPLDYVKRELAKNDMTVADLSPRLRQLTEDLAQTGTAAGRQIRQTLRQRAEGVRVDGEVTGGQYSRIMPNLTKAFGLRTTDSNFFQAMRAVQGAARRKADRMFGAAYRTNIEMSPSMFNTLTKTKAGRQALELAETIAENEQRQPPTIPGVGQTARTKDLHLLMQGLDDAVDDAYQNLPRGVADSFKRVRDQFVREVEVANPALGEARRMWGTQRQAVEAMEMGQNIFKEDAAGAGITAAILRRMNPNAQLHYKIGVMSEIERRMGQKIDVADMTRDLLQKRNTRNILRQVFGDEDKFRQFMRLLETEHQMQLTFEQAVGNSATARRLTQGATDFGERLAQLAGYGFGIGTGTGIPPSTTGFLAGRLYRGTGAPAAAQRTYEDIAQNQANLLMGDDLSRIMEPVTLGGLLETGAPTTGAFATGGLLGSGMINPEVQGRFGQPQ